MLSACTTTLVSGQRSKSGPLIPMAPSAPKLVLTTDHPELPGFTSMLSLDVEKETGKPFNKERLHSAFHRNCHR